MCNRLLSNQIIIDQFLDFMPPQNNVISPIVSTAITKKVPDQSLSYLLEKMQLHTLWDGNWNPTIEERENSLAIPKTYPSQSEADYAFLNDIAKEAIAYGIPVDALPSAVMHVFERSGLYRAEKRKTITNYAVPKAISNATLSSRVISNQDFIKLPRLDSTNGVLAFSDRPPLPRDYVLHDLIVAVKVCVLAGLGGVSKTMLAMQMSVCIALGMPYMGKKTQEGSVMLILGEEDKEEADRRFNAIAKAMRLSPEQINNVKQRIRAFPMNGLDSRLTAKTSGSLEGTSFTHEIVSAAKNLESESSLPVRMIVLDHAGLIHGGEFNAREDVVQTMQQVNRIAKESGASVLILAHSPKAAVNKEKADSSDVAGSAAWVDLARAVFVLRTMDDTEGRHFGISSEDRNQYASLTVVKNNYGPTGEKFWLHRITVQDYGVSVLKHVDLAKPEPPLKGAEALHMRILTKIKEHVGQYSKTGFRDAFSGKTGNLKASKADVEIALNDLLGRGELMLREPTGIERKKYGLHHTTKQVLDIKL